MEKEKVFTDLFKESETVTAQHILWENFLKIRPGLKGSFNKFVFYVSLGENYGQPYLKDANGDLGYKLEVINNAPSV